MPLSLRMLLRDWRAGELRVLAAALVLAVAGITAVGFFTDRVRLALERQAGELLGGDVSITSGQPLSAGIEGLMPATMRQAHTVEFPSMALSAAGRSALVAVRAVSPEYPLRGTIRVGEQAFAPDRAIAGGPQPGTVWVESRLLGALGIAPGDDIGLGEASFRVAGLLAGEPLAGGGMLFGAAPHVMLALEDLERTGLVQPASRVRHRYLFAGDAAEVAAFRKVAEPLLATGERLETAEDAQPQLRSALDRARSFLSLAALSSVLLAGVAVAMSARRFISRHLDGSAVMRCLGARQSTVLRLYALQLTWLGLAAIAVGGVLGWFAQYGLERIMGAMLQMSLPAPSWWPLMLGAVTALVTLLGFALPPLLHLRHVPAVRVLRGDAGAMSPAGLLAYLAGGGAIVVLLLWYSSSVRLGVQVAAGAAAALAVLAAIAFGLLSLLRVIQPWLAPAWRPGVRSLVRRRGSTVVQLMAFGLGLSVLLSLLVVRDDLLAAWDGALPADAPNRFLVNVQPGQVEALQAFFAEQGLDVPELFPMVRGRLVDIAGNPVDIESFDEERARNLLRREFNLSWAEVMQSDNRIVAGRWWQLGERGSAEVSVEEGIAEAFGISIGDELVFDVGGERLAVRVTSLRSVAWDSFRVNFFVIAPPGVFDAHPATWISSLHVPRDDHRVLDRLVRAFPNVTVLDVAAIMDHVRSIMDRVTAAVEYVFLFTLVAGLLVMYAAIQATLDERIREAALLRTLGAGRGQLLRALMAEFAVLGLLAGLAAATMAGLSGWAISTWILDLTYTPGMALWLVGALVGMLGIGVAGIAGTRHVLDVPPLGILRAS
ncbi:MAG: FtsX-like permease family protein [Gammaproteobacteria bacterium]|nr:FtsX-like permease family protein [Gammaproteobacteria bacterium]